MIRLAHLVQAGSLSLAGGVLGLETVFDLDVEIATVLLVGAVVERALNLLSLLDSKHILEVEDGLLPVSVLSVWPSGEADCLVAGGKVNVEPGDKSVDEVIPSGDEVEWAAESQILDRALVKVEGENERWVGNDGLHLDSIDERLRQGGLLERRVVETIDVIPNCDMG